MPLIILLNSQVCFDKKSHKIDTVFIHLIVFVKSKKKHSVLLIIREAFSCMFPKIKLHKLAVVFSFNVILLKKISAQFTIQRKVFLCNF